MSKVAHNFKDKARTGDVLITESVDFGSLLLSEPVLRGLKNSGFVRPSPIQLKAIPLGRCGLDLIVQAKSGTGKTCVFSVIALESILTDTASTQVLVLAPTREIAVQIWEVINSIGSAMKELECHTFIGGLPLHEDRVKLKKCHIAVGSPGRIKQLIEGGVLKTDSIRLFVLDEADKLLEESFQEQINWIYSALPENKQMLALSATYPEYLADHLTAYMRNPTFLRLNISDPALLGIRQYYHTVPYHPMSHVIFEEKSKVLINILSSVSFEQCLVFSNLQTRAQTLADTLTSNGWPTACIAGCLDQKDRNNAMARLKTYKCRILISTDLTSRGIDADKVNMVINLDVPKDHETYLHRIGRAGRFGSFGIAITLISDGQERLDLDSIEKRCNTHVHSLPDPLPSDLAKPGSPIFLDDVVSSEVINTSNQHNGQNSQSKQTVMSPAKSRVIVSDNDSDKNFIIDTLDKTSGQTADSNGSNIGNCQNVESVHEDAKAIINGVTEKGCVTKGDMVKKHNWTLDFEDCTTEQIETRAAVVYEEVEYSKMSELEFSLEGGIKDNGYNKNKNGYANSKTLESGNVVDNQPQSKEESMSCNNDVDNADIVRNAVEPTEKERLDVFEKERFKGDFRVSKQEDMLPEVSVLKDDDESTSKIENQMLHKVQVNDLSLHRNCKISSLPSRNVNISYVYKNNIGFKRLHTPHSYSTAKESLKAFRDRCDTDKESMDNKMDCSVPKIDCQDVETETLTKAVSQLQDLLESRLIVHCKEASIVSNEVKVAEEIKNNEAVRNGSISSEDEFEAKNEMLNRKFNVSLLQDVLENCLIDNNIKAFNVVEITEKADGNESISSEDEFEAKYEMLNEKTSSGLKTDASDIQANDGSAELKDNSAYEEKTNGAPAKLEDKRNKKNEQKVKKQRYGYRGNFAIGHILQQERETKTDSVNCSEVNDYEDAGEALELVCAKEYELDDSQEVNIPELKGFAGNALAESIETGRSLTMYGEQKHSSSSALRADLEKNTDDSKMDNKYKEVNRIDAEGNKESDFETSSVSSVTDSESTESEEIQDKGARPKAYDISKKIASTTTREEDTTKTCKQWMNKSKTAIKSKDSDANKGKSQQEQWRQWYEQYANWHQQSINMWGYPGTFQNQSQNGNRKADVQNYGYPSRHYHTPMYYPYQNYQQEYPYGYFPYPSPYSQQSTNPNFSEHVGSALQFQEEYLKQMSKYWKKEKVKK